MSHNKQTLLLASYFKEMRSDSMLQRRLLRQALFLPAEPIPYIWWDAHKVAACSLDKRLRLEVRNTQYDPRWLAPYRYNIQATNDRKDGI